MKKLTLSIDDHVFSAVMDYAAKHGSSISSLISGYLNEIVNQENRVQKARLKIRELSAQSVAQIGSHSWTRSDLHER
jgi:hypothetical protein